MAWRSIKRERDIRLVSATFVSSHRAHGHGIILSLLPVLYTADMTSAYSATILVSHRQTSPEAMHMIRRGPSRDFLLLLYHSTTLHVLVGAALRSTDTSITAQVDADSLPSQ